MKVCNTCGKERPLADYMSSKKNSDGLFNKCNPCIESNIHRIRHRKTDTRQEIIDAHKAMKVLPLVHGYSRHHWSYNEEHWLDVILVKNEDHFKLHKYITYHPATKKFKDAGGTLLATKKMHKDYINHMLTWHEAKKAA